MRIPLYQADALADRPFTGNPAAVCPLDAWLPDEVMQAIAAENNLPETAFFVPEGAGWRLRWFTPTTEVDLCGYATLASAYVILDVLKRARGRVLFATEKAGELPVTRDSELLALDFPAWPPKPCAMPAGLAAALGHEPAAVPASRDYLAVYDDRDDVASLAPAGGAPTVAARRQPVMRAARRPGRDRRPRCSLPRRHDRRVMIARGGKARDDRAAGWEIVMSRIAMVALCFGILLAGPALAQSKTTIQQLNDKWGAAFDKGDAAALAAMYAEDAYVLPPGHEMVNGRGQIRAFWAGAVQQLGHAKLTTVDLQRLGRGAAREIGTFRFETKAQPPQPVIGKYVVVWRRIGGHWLLATDIWNTNK